MEELIKKLAKYLFEIKADPDGWGIISLPGDYDMPFEFTGVCELKLREDVSKRSCPVKNTVKFGLLEKGGWIPVTVFEKELEKLLKGITFSAEEIEKFCKDWQE